MEQRVEMNKRLAAQSGSAGACGTRRCSWGASMARHVWVYISLGARGP